MTPEVEKKRRQLYESRVVLPDTAQWNEDSKSYTGANFWLAQFGWDAFNAALDAVLIELPDACSLPDDAWVARDQCAAAITATGLGLRIK